jgi:hypothetical protein
MEAEDNGGVDKAMNDKDLEYLSNINTSPGPSAGRSIDPTKPGPDADAAIRQEPKMTDEERKKLVAELRATGFQCFHNAADEIERLANAEAVWKGRAEAYLQIANDEAALVQSDADRPLGFRTNDVPNPYAEGPQSDARPLAWHWNSKLEGWTYTSDARPVAWRYAYPLYPDEWNLTQDQLTAEERMRKESCVVEPLYAGPLTDRSGK